MFNIPYTQFVGVIERLMLVIGLLGMSFIVSSSMFGMTGIPYWIGLALIVATVLTSLGTMLYAALYVVWYESESNG